MAYSQNNLLMLNNGGIGSSGPRIWLYSEAIAASALDASGYISNGGKLGMRVNDLVLGVNTATGIWSGHTVMTVNATTGAVDLSNGTTISDGSSNTD